MYWRTPPISAVTREAYSAASVSSVVRQTCEPSVFLSASTAPLEPPATHTTLSPSMVGDSEYFHLPTAPLKSVSRFFFQISLPVAASAQSSSPMAPSAITILPSVVGVARLLPQVGLPSNTNVFPNLVVQSVLPSAASIQTSAQSSPRSARV